MPRPTLDFWFDFASTYSFLSAMRIDALAEQSEITVRWKPFLLGPIFADNGWDTSPFNIYEAKGRYMWRDLERLSQQRGVPLVRPEIFPQFALLATRVAVAAKNEPWLANYCQALFTSEYGKGQDVTDVASVTAALQKSGTNPRIWIEKASETSIKQALKDRVEKARSLGIFGAPTFITSDQELFWGDDRLEAAVAWANNNPHM